MDVQNPVATASVASSWLPSQFRYFCSNDWVSERFDNPQHRLCTMYENDTMLKICNMHFHDIDDTNIIY